MLQANYSFVTTNNLGIVRELIPHSDCSIFQNTTGNICIRIYWKNTAKKVKGFNVAISESTKISVFIGWVAELSVETTLHGIVTPSSK